MVRAIRFGSVGGPTLVEELSPLDALNDYDWADIALKVAYAIVILLITWALARAVKWAFAKAVGRIGFLQRSGSDGKSLGEALGQIAALVVWLFGLVAVLQVFELDQVLAPIQDLLGGLLEFLPNIIAAGFVFVVGALIAKIVRELILTALGAVDIDRMLHRGRAGVASATGTSAAGATSSGSTTTSTTTSTMPTGDGPSTGATIAKTAATVVYALIMIVVAIAALQILEISAISDPAEQMLTTIFDAIPQIIAAALLLGIGVMIARFAGDLLQQLLEGLGTDRALAEIGVGSTERSPSSVLAKVAQVAIVLFFAVMAAQLLDFPQITEFLSEVLGLGGRVLFGGAIIAAGFFVANLLGRMAGGSLATELIRYATIVLFAAMGLSYMGIADNIIELAFGALVVGGALAAAIAFGLGGRDAASRTLDRIEARAETSPSSPASPTTPPTTPPTTGSEPL